MNRSFSQKKQNEGDGAGRNYSEDMIRDDYSYRLHTEVKADLQKYLREQFCAECYDQYFTAAL